MRNACKIVGVLAMCFCLAGLFPLGMVRAQEDPASGEDAVTWKWVHWVNETFDPETFSGRQSDNVEMWSLALDFDNVLVDFQDDLGWTERDGIKIWRRMWELSLTYYTESNQLIRSVYGIKGFYFGTDNEVTSQNLGRTEPPYNVGMRGEFAPRTDSSINSTAITLNGQTGRLVEFNITYTNISIFSSEAFTEVDAFNMTVIFHITHVANETRVKIDTILDWGGVDFASASTGQAIYTTMHNQYRLEDLETNQEITPFGTPTESVAVFQEKSLDIAGFDLGNTYTIHRIDATSETKTLRSLIEYKENIEAGVSRGIEYYYWTLMNWTDADVNQVVYDPTITLFTGAKRINRDGLGNDIPGTSIATILPGMVVGASIITIVTLRKRKTIIKG